MRRQKRINGSEVLADIRVGMSESELRLKYQLSEKGIDRVFRKLVSTDAISRLELCSKYPAYKSRQDCIKQRQAPRAELTVPLPLYDIGSGSLGIVRDISTTGLRVAGIEAEVGEVKTLQLPVDLFIQADPLLICAKCAWVETRGNNKRYTVAGFQITDLSEADASVLECFINFLILGGSGEWQVLQ
ncbi:MAG: PilZ domain-containing protein [Desulfomonile tiedjei]|uniref:PilZ domain-containing protein n=1 Tax=Desulfomonile tiedjei TaxID=2358 RepID=A0A9D6Z1H9_9BACT|nr:PilZ domain-containing protein [Desulfomonile tiedjei]